MKSLSVLYLNKTIRFEYAKNQLYPPHQSWVMTSHHLPPSGDIIIIPFFPRLLLEEPTAFQERVWFSNKKILGTRLGSTYLLWPLTYLLISSMMSCVMMMNDACRMHRVALGIVESSVHWEHAKHEENRRDRPWVLQHSWRLLLWRHQLWNPDVDHQTQ